MHRSGFALGMCILFLYINPKPSAGNFRLILAANRDEIYKRPAKSAHYWEEDKTVIGGRDLEPGKEGGSWLALSTRGRIAALLNIMHIGEHPQELLGRGSLVSDPESINVHKYCNAGEAPKPECLSDEYLGISNSFIDTPFAKVTAGIEQFKDIISKYGSADEKKSLHNELTKFLKEETSHFPDSVMASFAPAVSTEYLKPYSSVYVNVPERGYGTR
ncbi:Transport and Golgi organization protein 2 [Gryllus bimaculatus]|nr:Transport and Golgi organization protein 2 [Gryllus bimaculatus]